MPVVPQGSRVKGWVAEAEFSVPAAKARDPRPQTLDPRLRRRFRGDSGQSLIIVILVLLAVAAVAALFIAVVAGNIGRVGRQGDVSTLNNIAEAGIRFADYQLTYSADGADWRPVTNQWYRFGDGEFRLVLTYPAPEPAMSRFIKIECEGRLTGNPQLKRSLTAYKPILLADYLRFVTNKDRSSLTARLGVSEVVQGSVAPFAFSHQNLFGAFAGRGTATFTSGSPTVTGVAGVTLWTAEIQPGYLLRLADGNWYVVQSVESNTSLTLASPYPSTNGTGLYSISNANTPMRVNSAVDWAGTVSAMLGLNQRMEVLGSRTGTVPWQVWPYTTGTATFTTNSSAVTGLGTAWTTAGVVEGDLVRLNTDPDTPDNWYEIHTVNSDTSITLKRNYTAAGGTGNYTIRRLYAPDTRYQQPPSIDAADPTSAARRYLLLTRDSGTWAQSGTTWYNTGWYGYGNGTYVDNTYDVQDAHNLAPLRDKWMNPSAGTNGWDTPGWAYTPTSDASVSPPIAAHRIAEVILWPIPTGTDPNTGAAYTVPTIQLTRYDGLGWHKSDGTYVAGSPKAVDTADTIYLPYPSNGVLFAEGSIRVAGTRPPATSPPPGQYFVAAANRYYDLTIVSGGTIYIEGDLMSPNTYINNYNALTDPDLPLVSEAQNTRLALLARDHVCLNMTAFGARVNVPSTTGTGTTWVASGATNPGYWLVQNSVVLPANVLYFSYRTFQPAAPWIADPAKGPLLYLWHDGAPRHTPPPPYLTQVQISDDPTFLTNLFNWNTVVTPMTAMLIRAAGATNLYQSPRFSTNAAGLDWEVSVRPFLNIPPTGGGVQKNYYLRVFASANQDNYRLAGLQILPSRIDIDALIYAQEGSWFVLPGPWFNGPQGAYAGWPYRGSSIAAAPLDPVNGAVPSFRRAFASIPMDAAAGYTDYRPRIFLQGAIAESHTASLGDAHDWLSKWSGRDVPSGATDPETTVALTASAPRMSYSFDAGLRGVVYQDANGNNLARLPKLPCPPGVIVWEER